MNTFSMNGKGLFYLQICDSDIFGYPMQVGYDILMFDFFIEMNLPRHEKIVSIIPNDMHLRYCYLVGLSQHVAAAV